VSARPASPSDTQRTSSTKTLRYTEDKFDQDMRMTIGVNLATKHLNVNGKDLTLTLIMWDLGGQPRFYDVVSDYFNGAKFAIAVYDVTRPYTLERLHDWIGRFKEAAPDCDLIVVGNKIDERSGDSGVPLEEGSRFQPRLARASTRCSRQSRGHSWTSTCDGCVFAGGDSTPCGFTYSPCRSKSTLSRAGPGV